MDKKQFALGYLTATEVFCNKRLPDADGCFQGFRGRGCAYEVVVKTKRMKLTLAKKALSVL